VGGEGNKLKIVYPVRWGLEMHDFDRWSPKKLAIFWGIFIAIVLILVAVSYFVPSSDNTRHSPTHYAPVTCYEMGYWDSYEAGYHDGYHDYYEKGYFDCCYYGKWHHICYYSGYRDGYDDHSHPYPDSP